MADYVVHRENINYDQEAYERLAVAIIKQAYIDLVDVRKRCVTLKNPGKNKRTIKMYERMMAEVIADRMSCGLEYASNHLNFLRSEDLTYISEKARSREATLTKWFHSGQFQIYSCGIECDAILERADAEVNRWLNGGKKDYHAPRMYAKKRDGL